MIIALVLIIIYANHLLSHAYVSHADLWLYLCFVIAVMESVTQMST